MRAAGDLHLVMGISHDLRLVNATVTGVVCGYGLLATDSSAARGLILKASLAPEPSGGTEQFAVAVRKRSSAVIRRHCDCGVMFQHHSQ